MQKIRMNTEFRNKILNRYVDSAEKENTQEKEAFLQAREDVDKAYNIAFPVAQKVVSRSYPEEDVNTCKSLPENIPVIALTLSVASVTSILSSSNPSPGLKSK